VLCEHRTNSESLPDQSSSILFLGSGGARFVVARQLRASGGMWMRFGDTQIHVDPGPGALVRALSSVPPCNPRALAAIVLSHKHLDHAGDVNALVEAMTSGGFRRRGMLLAPPDAFEDEPVVLPYAQRFVDELVRLSGSAGPYRIGEVELRTSMAHLHAVETFGLHFSYKGLRVAYLPCGRYFDGLAADYARLDPQVLIVNVLRFRDEMNVDHLTWSDARAIVAAVRPKVAVFQHFGTKMLEAGPDRLAQELEDELGLRVIAAYDGLQLDLDTQVAAVAG
jgi:phosphoribosyl 1,2-cyclic phosphodiesterase